MTKRQQVFSIFIILFSLPGLNFDMLHIECNSAIAFTGDYDIYVADLCANQYIQLTNDDANYYPAVAPDGEHIVFATVDHLDVIDVDGSNRLTITGSNVGYARFPTWSPDGQYISFSGSGDMYVVRADGTDLQQLTSSRIIGSGSASAWSPDGQTIAFVAHHSESMMYPKNWTVK